MHSMNAGKHFIRKHEKISCKSSKFHNSFIENIPLVKSTKDSLILFDRPNYTLTLNMQFHIFCTES